MSKPLYSLSISGRITLDLHSLNNEGGEGNQTLTRQVTIVAHDENGKPRLATVNAISGDMMKHIQAEHLHRICTDLNDLPLCHGCRLFSANRINDDLKFFTDHKGEKNTVAILDKLLPHCTMDDLLGILITQGNRSNPRKSVAEYGWIVALPELSRTDSYFHVKYDPERKGTKASTDQAEGSNTGQAIFHRPANSGVYAVVANFELWRIGFNDVAWTYAITDKGKREARAKALLQSVLYTFLQPNGAQRNTQNPHIVDFEGVISLSHKPVPAPTVSPLNEAYRSQIEGITGKLNAMLSTLEEKGSKPEAKTEASDQHSSLSKDRLTDSTKPTPDGSAEAIEDNSVCNHEESTTPLQTQNFNSLQEFAEKMTCIISTVTPYSVRTAQMETATVKPPVE